MKKQDKLIGESNRLVSPDIEGEVPIDQSMAAVRLMLPLKLSSVQ